MKRIMCLVLSAVLLLSLAACSKNNPDNNSPANTTSSQNVESIPSSFESTIQTETTLSETGDSTDVQAQKEQLLQSTRADLDADGKDEVIEAYKVTSKSSENGTNEIEGILRIKGSTASKELVFIKKNEGITGVMSSMDIRDLDGDGAKDIVIIVPDSGAAFDLNYFFIYSLKKDIYYSYNADSELNDFAGSFIFKYEGKGILGIANPNYNFSAKMNIVSINKSVTADDENNSAYENSWVEPVPVVINENSKLTVLKGSDGKSEIKVPLPVFGQATADMIGEVDLYYRIDENFMPYMYRFEVFDFTDSGSIKLGGVKIVR